MLSAGFLALYQLRAVLRIDITVCLPLSSPCSQFVIVNAEIKIPSADDPKVICFKHEVVRICTWLCLLHVLT